MSAYNFNHHSQVNGRDNHINFNGGLQVRTTGGQQHQSISNGTSVDTDPTRRFNQSPSASMPNQLGMSRPTSKTAMLFKQRRSMLEHLSCSICKGYLIDATVVNECMHSFCKSCIIKHLQHNTYCPAMPDPDKKCGMFINRSDPLTLRADKVLQSIVYKLIPGLYDDEMQKRRDFYGIEDSSSSEEEEVEDDDEGASPGSLNDRSMGIGDERSGIMPHPKPFYKHEDQIDISIEPQTMRDSPIVYFDDRKQSLITRIKPTQQSHKQQQIVKQMFSVVNSQQYKSYLRCQAMLTVAHLKKLITAKFNVCPGDAIELRYINDTLKDDYSLIDIAYIYDWRGNDHMRMFYVIERDISKITYQYESQTHGRSSAVTRQNSVMTSQAAKRVCIDPKPRIYEERKGKRVKYDQNNNGSNRLNGPRGEGATSTNNQASKKSITKPTQSSTVNICGSNSNENHKINGNKIQTTSNGALNRDSATGQRGANPQTSFKSQTSKVVHHPATTATKSNVIRSPRIIAVSSPTPPKFNSNLTFTAKPNASCSELQNGTARDQSASSPASRQLVPYIGKSFQSTTVKQASMVTMASFSAATSKIMTVSTATTSAGTITNSYQNLMSTSSGQKNPTPTINIRPEPRTSQLQIRIVTTKQGYSISKPLGGDLPINTVKESSPPKSKLNVAAVSRPLPAIAMASHHTQATKANNTSSTSSSATSSNHQNSNNNNSNKNNVNSNHNNHQSNNSGLGAGNNQHANSRQDNLDSQPSGRHLAKQKPVYKTLVDPTKVKPPNFKRH